MLCAKNGDAYRHDGCILVAMFERQNRTASDHGILAGPSTIFWSATSISSARAYLLQNDGKLTLAWKSNRHAMFELLLLEGHERQLVRKIFDPVSQAWSNDELRSCDRFQMWSDKGARRRTG